MPKTKAHNKSSLSLAAMHVFWARGYEATSMADLVSLTGVSRHGIYNDFVSKHGLFLASLESYRHEVVTPAFAQVEAKSAELPSVYDYFEHQISRAQTIGLPGPGCLIANTMTELVSEDEQVGKLIRAHNRRLTQGFLGVLKNANTNLPLGELRQLATSMTIYAQGLWSMSRVTPKAKTLRDSVKIFMALIEARLQNK